MSQLEFSVPGRPYRIFSDKICGIYKYYIVEDSSESTVSQGVEYNVSLTNYYFKTLAEVRVLTFDKFFGDCV